MWLRSFLLTGKTPHINCAGSRSGWHHGAAGHYFDFTGLVHDQAVAPYFFTVRNWRRATKGSIRARRKCAQWFFQRDQNPCSFRHW
jgi:hypothetical protein